MITGRKRQLWTVDVYIDGKLLDPLRSQKVYNHSPDGFNWGYGGSGPAQLALAILLEFTDIDTAVKHYSDFKWAFLACLKEDTFELDSDVVKKWIERQKNV